MSKSLIDFDFQIGERFVTSTGDDCANWLKRDTEYEVWGATSDNINGYVVKIREVATGSNQCYLFTRIHAGVRCWTRQTKRIIRSAL